MNNKIDFVITWVDGNDKKWKKEKERYLKKESSLNLKDSGISRYRDWNNLKYWFRGIEKYASWVNKIYFITYGHLPEWLNVNHPKIEIVNHVDFIPKEYLPTFNINTIENNFHRIKGLSETFVYFNDDMFLIDDVKEEDFFKHSKPTDSAILNVHCYSAKDTLVMTPVVDIGIINKYFNMKNVLRDNWTKWFNPVYGKGLIQNIILYQCPRFPGMVQHHLATSLKKETYEILWNKEFDILNETCKNKFRSTVDVNQWLFREWQLASGEFYPRKLSIGKSFNVQDGVKRITEYIMYQKGKMICINDAEIEPQKFIVYQRAIIDAFDSILPLKSSFEI